MSTDGISQPYGDGDARAKLLAPPMIRRRWPMRLHERYRCLADADGVPFFVHGDTAWSMVVQLSAPQVDLYLGDRAEKGFNTVLFNALEHKFSSQNPAYLDIDGNAPFRNPERFGAEPVDAYWRRVRYIVDQAAERGMAVCVNPAYLGIRGGPEGWATEVRLTPDATLLAYGRFIAQLLEQGNVIWCAGGDYAGDHELRVKQWRVIEGILSVRPGDLVTAHGARDDPDAYTHWKGFPGFRVNSIYTGTNPWLESLLARGRRPPLPYVLLEAYYEGEHGTRIGTLREQAWVALFSGACGHFFGSNPIWGFGEPVSNGGIGATIALARGLDSPGASAFGALLRFVRELPWWNLEPAATQLVGDIRDRESGQPVGAVASDRSWAAVWTGGTEIVLRTTAISPRKRRARWLDGYSGSWHAVDLRLSGPAGTVAFRPRGEGVLVID
jgi:hypothetical protein